MQLGQIMDNKIQKDQTPNCHFWRAGSKNRVSGAKVGYCACPLHSTLPKRWADHLSHPSNLTPGPTPTLTPLWGSEQGKLLLVFAPPCCSRGPNKALPKFLVWPLINFYWSGKAQNPGRYQNEQERNEVFACSLIFLKAWPVRTTVFKMDNQKGPTV